MTTNNDIKTKIVNLLIKYRHEVIYFFIGCGTTVVKLGFYLFLQRVFNLEELFSNIIAWIAAVLFAFFISRKYVFESQRKNAFIFVELITFTASRILTLLLFEMGLFGILVYIFDFKAPRDIYAHIIIAGFVFTTNYITGRFIVFRKKTN